jgi:hypothetical protein
MISLSEAYSPDSTLAQTIAAILLGKVMLN